MKNAELRYRQIHLDFHTSEHCPNVGGKFDEDQFIGALKKGHVNSITIFAQCHHGWCYYPTNTDMEHPNLQTDLVGRMLAAAKKADINNARIYHRTMAGKSRARTSRMARQAARWKLRRTANHASPYSPATRRMVSLVLQHALSGRERLARIDRSNGHVQPLWHISRHYR